MNKNNGVTMIKCYFDCTRSFSSVCDVAGRPIKANQERCVRKLWSDKHYARKILISVVVHEDVATHGTSAPDSSVDYLGKPRVELLSGLPQIEVTWSGSADWKPNGQTDALFYDAEGLGISSAKMVEDGIFQVTIEELCWYVHMWVPANLASQSLGIAYQWSNLLFLPVTCYALPN